MSYTRDEVRFLIAHQGDISDAEQGLQMNKNTLIADMGVLRGRFGDHARAVGELLHARRAASGKLRDDARARWLFCYESAQQATPSAVADVRATKIRDIVGEGAFVADVTCSVGTEGLAVSRAGLRYAGSDVDLVRLDMARHNLAGTSSLIYAADALVPAIQLNDVGCVIADPARRDGGRRISDPAHLIPPLPDLIAAWPDVPLAVKCAPGIDYSQWPGMVSVVSVDGKVKETCLYSQHFGRGREAVVLRGGENGGVDKQSADVLNSDMDDRPGEDLAGAPGRFIIDPDGAIVRAGLVRQMAVREGLWMLDERIAYLTGDRIPAGHTGAEFVAQLPLKKMKDVKRLLQELDCGSLEILVRGVDVNPDKLRKQLKLGGKRPLTLVCTRIGTAGVALVCGPRVGSGADNPSPS